MRSLNVTDGVMNWDGYDDLPVTTFSVEFRMPNIKRYTGIGCLRIHLQLYNVVMPRHRLVIRSQLVYQLIHVLSMVPGSGAI